jgi:hypothetical protein
MNLVTIVSHNLATSGALDGSMVTFGKPNKDGNQKVGSFARALAFATRDERIAAGHGMYATWLRSGNFRPLVNDILGVKLISKDAADYIEHTTLKPFAGRQIPKDKLVELCKYIETVVANKVAAGKPEPKGEKAFVYGVVKAIASAEQSDDETIEV